MFNSPMVVQLASVKRGFEPKWCESRIYDIFLAEMQTQLDQTLKSHCPAVLALLGKEPGGTLPLTPKDWRYNTPPPLHPAAELGSVYSWRPHKLAHRALGLKRRWLHLGGKPLRGKACHCSECSFPSFSSSQPSTVLPYLHNSYVIFSRHSLLLSSHFHLHLFNETQSYWGKWKASTHCHKWKLTNRMNTKWTKFSLPTVCGWALKALPLGPAFSLYYKGTWC